MDLEPVRTSERIETLDYLRGFALLGIILVNVLPLLSISFPDSREEGVYWTFLHMFVEGRFYTIFSFLFGYGFYLFISRANDKGHNGRKLFLRRLLALFVLGLFHSLFNPGDALLVYAVAGLLVLPVHSIRKEAGLWIGLVLLLACCWLGFKVLLPIPLIVLGHVAGQYGLFTESGPNKKHIAIFCAAAGIASIAALFWQYSFTPDSLLQAGSGENLSMFLQSGIMIGPLVSAFYVSLLVLLLQSSLGVRIFTPLKVYGRMALTNYLLQTFLILGAGRFFGFNGDISLIGSFFFCIACYVIGIAVSVIWLRFFRYGPMEWLLRSATYWQRLPIRS